MITEALRAILPHAGRVVSYSGGVAVASDGETLGMHKMPGGRAPWTITATDARRIVKHEIEHIELDGAELIAHYDGGEVIAATGHDPGKLWDLAKLWQPGGEAPGVSWVVETWHLDRFSHRHLGHGPLRLWREAGRIYASKGENFRGMLSISPAVVH